MNELVIWTCYSCHSTRQTYIDIEATAVPTPSCCGKNMWMSGTVTRDAASQGSAKENT